MRIDLHTHSVVSDGTDAPERVIAVAAEAGLDVVGLTDHDSDVGWEAATEAALALDIALVRGVELSCAAEHMSVHVLSYLHDPEDPDLRAEMDRIRSSRVRRARSIVERLAADLHLTWDDVLAKTEPGATVGRPHIADALVARGHVPDRSAAFTSLLTARSKYHVPHYAIGVVRAVGLIRAAGGVPVLAHAGAVARGRVVSDATIRVMVDAGLAGIEVHHRDNPPEQRERLAELASRWGLLATGASDYHGDGKPNRIGENLTAPEVLAAIEEQGRLPVVRR